MTEKDKKIYVTEMFPAEYWEAQENAISEKEWLKRRADKQQRIREMVFRRTERIAGIQAQENEQLQKDISTVPVSDTDDYSPFPADFIPRPGVDEFIQVKLYVKEEWGSNVQMRKLGKQYYAYMRKGKKTTYWGKLISGKIVKNE